MADRRATVRSRPAPTSPRVSVTSKCGGWSPTSTIPSTCTWSASAVLSRSGRPPLPHDAGLKDTISLRPGEVRRDHHPFRRLPRPLPLPLPQRRTRGHGNDGQPRDHLGASAVLCPASASSPRRSHRQADPRHAPRPELQRVTPKHTKKGMEHEHHQGRSGRSNRPARAPRRRRPHRTGAPALCRCPEPPASTSSPVMAWPRR